MINKSFQEKLLKSLNNLGVVIQLAMHVRSRWLEIGQVLIYVVMDRNETEVNKKGKNENNKANIQPTRSIQDLLCGQKITFSCRTNVGDQSGQDGPSFLALVANHRTGHLPHLARLQIQ